MSKLIMVRPAQDEYHAVRVADAMERAGGDVFCIKPAQILGGKRHLVYCKIADSSLYDAIDLAIEATWEEADAEPPTP